MGISEKRMKGTVSDQVREEGCISQIRSGRIYVPLKEAGSIDEQLSNCGRAPERSGTPESRASPEDVMRTPSPGDTQGRLFQQREQ